MPLTMKRIALVLAVAATALGAPAAAAIAMVAGDSGPAGPTGVHITPLSKGTLASSVHAKAAGIESARPTAARTSSSPGSPSIRPARVGWHSHPGPVLVTVGKGTLTVYDATKHGCRRSTVTVGDAFIEDGHHIHLARNEGSTPVELNATFLARPGTTQFLKTEPQPRGCNV